MELESRTLQDGTTFRLFSGAPGARILAAAAQSQQAAAWSSKFLPAAGDVQPLPCRCASATLPACWVFRYGGIFFRANQCHHVLAGGQPAYGAAKPVCPCN